MKYRFRGAALASHGADMNVFKQDGLTPLMIATFTGQLTAVQSLVEAGANPNLIHAGEPTMAFTALDLAIQKDHRPIAEYLQSCGAISFAKSAG